MTQDIIRFFCWNTWRRKYMMIQYQSLSQFKVFLNVNKYSGPPEFTTWISWSTCSKNCGDGIKTRTRSCSAFCDNINPNDLSDTETCTGSCRCQNGGTIITEGDNQACFTKHIVFSLDEWLIMSQVWLKQSKNSECSCIDGYTGDFCEFKTEQNYLLFLHQETPLVFNADGNLIEENADIEGHVEVEGSCSTMLNGEPIIFGGKNLEQQVQFK